MKSHEYQLKLLELLNSYDDMPAEVESAILEVIRWLATHVRMERKRDRCA